MLARRFLVRLSRKLAFQMKRPFLTNEKGGCANAPYDLSNLASSGTELSFHRNRQIARASGATLQDDTSLVGLQVTEDEVNRLDAIGLANISR